MTELNTVLLVVVVALLAGISYLLDSYRRELEKRIDQIERELDDHKQSSYLHRS